MQRKKRGPQNSDFQKTQPFVEVGRLQGSSKVYIQLRQFWAVLELSLALWCAIA